MKTFRDLREEHQEDTRPVRLRLLPAIKHESGKLYIGKRGDDHSEIRDKHMDENGPLKGEAGFYDTKEKKFMSRKEAAAHAPRPGSSGESTEFLTAAEKDEPKKRLASARDTTDTMSDMQRMRKYGTFEEETDPMFKGKKGEPHKTYYYALGKTVLARRSGSSSGGD